MQHEKTKELAMTALMTALIFTATYIIKIPNPATGGYTHMGEKSYSLPYACSLRLQD